MSRRRGRRIRHRLSAEFEVRGAPYRAIVLDVSAEGLFVQSEVAVAPGDEFTLRVHGPRFPAAELRGRVLRREVSPPHLAMIRRRGFAFLILDAPGAFYESVAEVAWRTLGKSGRPPGLDPLPVHGTPVEIEFVVEDAGPGPERPHPSDLAGVAPTPPPEPSDAPPPLESATEALAALGAEGTEAAPDDAGPPCREEGDLTPTPPEEPTARAGDPLLPDRREDAWRPPEALLRAEVWLAGGSELEDVAACLAEIGVDVHRHVPRGPIHFDDWERPPRLFLVGARTALQQTLTTSGLSERCARVVVADSDSHTLSALLRRQGYEYLVSRPVRRAALRLFLAGLLFRGLERRRAPRFAIGSGVTLHTGLRRRRAMLLDLSTAGCRLVLGERLAVGTRLTLRLSGDVTGAKPLALSGRVRRCDSVRKAGALEASLGLEFEATSESTQERLARLLALRAAGPAPLRGEPRELEAPNGQEPRSRERRRHPRAALRHQAVVLQETTSRVRHVLFGTDLSTGGMRVEPHPELVEGERFRVAIYSSTSHVSVVVQAEVVRDHGLDGLSLRFEGVDSAAHRSIEALMAERQSFAADGEGPAVYLAERTTLAS